MKKSRFMEEQMVTILREADRTTVAKAAKKHKVSDATIYARRKHFGQMGAADIKRLKALALENRRLKKLLAEQDLDIETLKEVNAKNGEPAGSGRATDLHAHTGPESAPLLRSCLIRRVPRPATSFACRPRMHQCSRR